MSTKLLLATKYCDLHRVFDGPSFNERVYDPEKIAKSFTIEHLQDKINAVKNAIVEKEKRLKIEEYYSTPEGIKYKVNKETERNNCLTNINNIKQSFDNWLVNEIQSEYGNLWTSRITFSYSGCNIEIGIKNQDPTRVNFTFEFGLTFTIQFDLYNPGNSEPQFKMNYGTSGSFDILEDKNRKKYLYGMGCFIANTIFLNLLKNKCIEYNKQIQTYYQIINKIDNDLENPPITFL